MFVGLPVRGVRRSLAIREAGGPGDRRKTAAAEAPRRGCRIGGGGGARRVCRAGLSAAVSITPELISGGLGYFLLLSRWWCFFLADLRKGCRPGTKRFTRGAGAVRLFAVFGPSGTAGSSLNCSPTRHALRRPGLAFPFMVADRGTVSWWRGPDLPGCGWRAAGSIQPAKFPLALLFNRFVRHPDTGGGDHRRGTRVSALFFWAPYFLQPSGTVVESVG